VPAWIALVAYVLGSMALNFSAFGRNVLAVGGGEDAARLMGLPVNRVKFAVYSLSGLMAGLAAFSSRPNSAPASRPKASAGSCLRSRRWSSVGRF